MAYEALYTRGRPKNLAQLIGQEHISTTLSRAISGNKLSHAYLLIGTRGTGKTSTARLLAKAMNCERVLEAQRLGKALTAKEIPCNKCESCLTIDSSPDNVEFDAASNRSVDDVTRLLSTAYMAPIQSRVKTFIIDEVHMLSFEAVNSILKLIEEPPPNVAFFLATTELNKVPMTIRSRCQMLNFRLIPQETIAPYLKKLAGRLEVELQEEAAKKIARLAEGSMRDALTYLDQCYAMADKIITIDDVDQTLGLLSDADLDEIISAVRMKSRSSVAKTIAHAYSSGLSSISIAESLITRLRDLEFKILDDGNDSELRTLEQFINELRETVLEMQGSGIPDIILEMSLMKLAASSSVNLPTQTVTAVSSAPIPKSSSITFSGNIENDKYIFYDMIDKLETIDKTIYAATINAVPVSFDGTTLTLGHRVKMLVDMIRDNVSALEKYFTQFAGRTIKISLVYDPKLPRGNFDRMKPQEKDVLKRAMNAFQTNEFKEIEES